MEAIKKYPFISKFFTKNQLLTIKNNLKNG